MAKRHLKVLGDGLAWANNNRIPLSILSIQYGAIAISAANNQTADFVLWIWGMVAFLIGAITGGAQKYNTGFWFVVQLIFGGLLAVAGYYFLP